MRRCARSAAPGPRRAARGGPGRRSTGSGSPSSSSISKRPTISDERRGEQLLQVLVAEQSAPPPRWRTRGVPSGAWAVTASATPSRIVLHLVAGAAQRGLDRAQLGEQPRVVERERAPVRELLRDREVVLVVAAAGLGGGEREVADHLAADAQRHDHRRAEADPAEHLALRGSCAAALHEPRRDLRLISSRLARADHLRGAHRRGRVQRPAAVVGLGQRRAWPGRRTPSTVALDRPVGPEHLDEAPVGEARARSAPRPPRATSRDSRASGRAARPASASSADRRRARPPAR